MILHIKQAKQKIALDDTPGSPVFELDLTNQSINEKAPTLAGVFAVYQGIAKDIRFGEEVDENLAVQVASIYRVIIETLLGRDAYKEILAYIRDGEPIPEEELTSIMAPIVVYLQEQFYSVITANRNIAVMRYLDGFSSEPDAI